MPPSGHSSSHHSSSSHSSHSSSHHSSSHSSSRSHSSSSHSHSSHSSSHHTYATPVRSNHRSSAPVHRTRTSQPYGWDKAKLGAVGHFYGKTHDYDYYPQAWTAPDGRHFEEGYYDENGQHYDNLIMVGSETMLKCDYCGNRMVYKWKEGDLPVCDKCGAPLRVDISDKEDKTYSGNERNNNSQGGMPKIPLIGKIAIGIMICAAILPLTIILYAVFFVFKESSLFNRVRYEDTYTENSVVENSIYVEEIGRTCYLDGEDWYDDQTECWFYFNDSVSPYQWQYWYEGISSDYGDYGWMEYDMNEEVWYIETDDGNWVHLPSDYDTSRLWHMTDEYTNAYE